jgi:hypothetical protein
MRSPTALESVAEDGTEPFWIAEIEKAVGQVSLDRIPEQPAGVCRSKTSGTFYRVLLARYEPFQSRARICHVVFIPSRPRRFQVKQKTSTILSALILSIRFRQNILPFIETLKLAPQKTKAAEILRLERELHLIEAESEEFGLSVDASNKDELPLLREFSEGEKKEFLKKSIQEWTTSRQKLSGVFVRLKQEDPISVGEFLNEATDVVTKAMQEVAKTNSKFIEILSEGLLAIEKISPTRETRLQET